MSCDAGSLVESSCGMPCASMSSLISNRRPRKSIGVELGGEIIREGRGSMTSDLGTCKLRTLSRTAAQSAAERNGIGAVPLAGLCVQAAALKSGRAAKKSAARRKWAVTVPNETGLSCGPASWPKLAWGRAR